MCCVFLYGVCYILLSFCIYSVCVCIIDIFNIQPYQGVLDLWNEMYMYVSHFHVNLLPPHLNVQHCIFGKIIKLYEFEVSSEKI